MNNKNNTSFLSDFIFEILSKSYFYGFMLFLFSLFLYGLSVTGVIKSLDTNNGTYKMMNSDYCALCIAAVIFLILIKKIIAIIKRRRGNIRDIYNLEIDKEGNYCYRISKKEFEKIQPDEDQMQILHTELFNRGSVDLCEFVNWSYALFVIKNIVLDDIFGYGLTSGQKIFVEMFVFLLALTALFMARTFFKERRKDEQKASR